MTRKHARLRSIGPRIASIDTRSAKPPPKRADPFYLSKQWRSLLDSIIAARGRVCEDRACPGPHHPGQRIFGDHISEIADGGALLDPANIMLRCPTSHARKTAAARAARMRQG